MTCKNCKSSKLVRILKIGKQPISSVFHKTKKYSEKAYSLDLYKCDKCDLIQFKKLAPLKEMYGTTYGYRTSLSRLMIDHIVKKKATIQKTINLKKNDFILDIGSNDGTFLNSFARENYINLFGVDPSAEKFKSYYNKKINLVFDYFPSSELFKKTKFKKFKMISSFAMFYDIEDPNFFCSQIYKNLDDRGIWISEFSYFPLLLKNLTYDQICHEHVTYYTLNTFNHIISKQGFKIIDVSFNHINGGSIEVICAKKNSKIKTNILKINKTLNQEKLINDEAYNRLQNRINNTKNILKLFLNNINKDEIIGYGASTKGNIVLNQCGITSKDLKYICDENSYKFNRFTPGSNIKIISKENMRRLKPKYLLVLIWSFRKEVIKQELNFLKNGGKMIFHLPSFHIIDKHNYKNFLNRDFKDFAFEI